MFDVCVRNFLLSGVEWRLKFWISHTNLVSRRRLALFANDICRSIARNFCPGVQELKIYYLFLSWLKQETKATGGRVLTTSEFQLSHRIFENLTGNSSRTPGPSCLTPLDIWLQRRRTLQTAVVRHWPRSTVDPHSLIDLKHYTNQKAVTRRHTDHFSNVLADPSGPSCFIGSDPECRTLECQT